MPRPPAAEDMLLPGPDEPAAREAQAADGGGAPDVPKFKLTPRSAAVVALAVACFLGLEQLWFWSGDSLYDGSSHTG